MVVSRVLSSLDVNPTKITYMDQIYNVVKLQLDVNDTILSIDYF